MGQIIVDVIFATYFAFAVVGFIVAIVSPWQVHQSFDDESE